MRRCVPNGPVRDSDVRGAVDVERSSNDQEASCLDPGLEVRLDAGSETRPFSLRHASPVAFARPVAPTDHEEITVAFAQDGQRHTKGVLVPFVLPDESP